MATSGAERYVADVIGGRVEVGELVRLACERHRRDLDCGRERGIWFDNRAAMVAVAFFGLLKHSKGEWAGQPIILENWQQFLVSSIFGWKRDDGTRRYRVAYIEMPRKNGKTLLAAGIGCYLVVADREGGAEVYSAATTREQARLSHSEAIRMVRQSPELGRELKIYRDNIHSPRTFSKFEPLSSDFGTLDGLNPHGVIADELHAWKSRDLWDILQTATGARRQPLMLAITTAGDNQRGICGQWHDYMEKILRGVLADDSVFGVIYGIDQGDDWRDERIWRKANPNLGISKKVEAMRDEARLAGDMPTALNAFLTKHLDVWVTGETRWMNPEKWRLCNGVVDAERLRGRRCYGGLDLSSTNDVTALVWAFEPAEAGGQIEILCRFFIPEANILGRARRDKVPFDVWAREGLVVATPGEVVDYDWILAQVERDCQDFAVVELAFDRWGSAFVVNQLQDKFGFAVDEQTARETKCPLLVQFGQGFFSMSAPMKELERLVAGRGLAHGGHAVLSWMADNVVARVDPAGNIKPDKERSREKIDGIVALIMALARLMSRRQQLAEKGKSVYVSRGIRTI